MTVNFIYKNDKISNIISFILFIIFVISIIIILISKDIIINKVLFILLSFIITNVLIIFLNKAFNKVNAQFTFDKHSFIYEYLNNEYTINFNEVEYIQRKTYMDSDNFIKREREMYLFKIKNGGTFVFKSIDDSLSDAMEKLSNKLNIEIEE